MPAIKRPVAGTDPSVPTSAPKMSGPREAVARAMFQQKPWSVARIVVGNSLRKVWRRRSRSHASTPAHRKKP